MHGLVEVVRGGGRGAVAPQHVHHLLAMQPMARREREQLDELPRLLQAPGPVGHRLAVDLGGKPAQQRDTDLAHGPSMTDPEPFWKSRV